MGPDKPHIRCLGLRFPRATSNTCLSRIPSASDGLALWYHSASHYDIMVVAEDDILVPVHVVLHEGRLLVEAAEALPSLPKQMTNLRVPLKRSDGRAQWQNPYYANRLFSLLVIQAINRLRKV